ncbi:hypothetical protein [Desulfobacterium sp. N47]|uniref:Uncharacterized protein n=1 Tax=uncultured Desulfobacterium sp. TaxID=201089 RepID=E1YKB9_9BACT|nr:unknown protein [uncultured Desulfobacterium sp.]
MYDDPIVDEVRKIREKLAEKHNFDLGVIFEDIRKRQSKVKKRLVRRQGRQIAEQEAAPDRNSASLHSGR